MINLIVIMVVFFIIYSIYSIYCIYQILRNRKIYKIRVKWIYSDDKRQYKYTYEKMFKPSFNNYFGFKYPNEKDFK